ncbi:Stp1/IreP family PP2C-type Ser/Thr phosphatase [Natribacillus halophilus]|nr:Stp1/IreP family PP2C-type Ser/Thr phosphatase [Natribacillus halophilus]
MEAVFRTDVGKMRAHNEDAGGIFDDEDMTLALVADGMGGHKAGDVASQMVMEALREAWKQRPPQRGEIDAWLKAEIKKANYAVFQKSLADDAFKGMGTTLVASVIYDNAMIIAHVGDSRAYRFHSSTSEQLTSDHSLVNEMVKTGQLPSEEAENHPRKNVLTRALGTVEEIDVDISEFDFPDTATLLLCSDGLSDRLGQKDIEETLRSKNTVAEAADALIQAALDRGGEDNISLILAHRDMNEEGTDS